MKGCKGMGQGEGRGLTCGGVTAKQLSGSLRHSKAIALTPSLTFVLCTHHPDSSDACVAARPRFDSKADRVPEQGMP